MPAMTLDSLFLDTLKDIYYAERQIMKTMPKITRAIQSPEVKEAMALHREQTQGQIERLQQVFEILGKRAQGVTCEAINGILEESAELLEEAPEASPVRRRSSTTRSPAMAPCALGRSSLDLGKQPSSWSRRLRKKSGRMSF